MPDLNPAPPPGTARGPTEEHHAWIEKTFKVDLRRLTLPPASSAQVSPAASASGQKLAKDRAAYKALKICTAPFDSGIPMPPGWKAMDPGKLKEMGFEGKEFEPPPPSGFRAKVVVSDDNQHVMLVFRGSKERPDWVADGKQGFGMEGDYYPRAIKLATQARKKFGDKLELAGHSLGGGMAAAAGIATHTKATTFNAAGVTPKTLTGSTVPGDVAGGMGAAIGQQKGEDRLRQLATANAGGRALVENYEVDGEILGEVQKDAEQLARVAKGVFKLFPLLGVAVPAAFADFKGVLDTILASDFDKLHREGRAPMQAAGHQNPLPDTQPVPHAKDFQHLLDELDGLVETAQEEQKKWLTWPVVKEGLAAAAAVLIAKLAPLVMHKVSLHLEPALSDGLLKQISDDRTNAAQSSRRH